MCLPALSAAGNLMSAKSSLDEGDAEALQAAQNARVAAMAAKDAITRGEADVSRYRVQEAQVLAHQRLAYAGAGVDVNAGTPVDVAAATEMAGAQDIDQLRRNSQLEAWGYKVQGQGYMTQAVVAQRRANNQAQSTILSGLTDMVNQGSSAAKVLL